LFRGTTAAYAKLPGKSKLPSSPLHLFDTESGRSHFVGYGEIWARWSPSETLLYFRDAGPGPNQLPIKIDIPPEFDIHSTNADDLVFRATSIRVGAAGDFEVLDGRWFDASSLFVWLQRNPLKESQPAASGGIGLLMTVHADRTTSVRQLNPPSADTLRSLPVTQVDPDESSRLIWGAHCVLGPGSVVCGEDGQIARANLDARSWCEPVGRGLEKFCDDFSNSKYLEWNSDSASTRLIEKKTTKAGGMQKLSELYTLRSSGTR
jgi:hypothetical protein